MSVFKKLQAARLELAHKATKKTGKNKFAGFEYFELGDFLPLTHQVFNDHGLCGVFSFDKDEEGKEWCILRVHDVDGLSFADFTSPVVYAEMAKSNPIQVLGATHTYMRRYMWLLALELTENDQVDAAETFKQPPKSAHDSFDHPEPVAKPKPKAKEPEHELQNEPPVAPPVEEIDETTPKVDAPDDTMFVEVMVKFGEACSTEQALARLWKVNQKAIDKLQKDDEQLFSNLKSMFGEFRTILKEKANGV
jgi:hypothetical protein